jgi:hypothetical protein
VRLRVWLLAIAAVGTALVAGTMQAADGGTRAVAKLNGVFSPRGFFNIIVRLNRLDGAEWAKLDLKKSQITVDFAPGTEVTAESMQQVERQAGYKPGPVTIEPLTPPVDRSAPGWKRLKHPGTKNAVARWFELNF